MYKVLIAEDETIERKVLRKTLDKHLGDVCSWIEARNGREAVALFDEHQPHIAILDIEMPGVTGLEAARHIRESGRHCAILFLTAFDRFDYAREAIALRALDFILKPYEERELVGSVEEAIRIYSRMTAEKPRTLSGDGILLGEENGEPGRLTFIRENIERYIRQNYSSELSMQDVARAMNYSDTYFCKLFKQCFRVNFSAYLNEFRVEQAKQRLRDTSDSVKDIGLHCGYADASYFIRVFKRHTGMTPAEYRMSK